MYKEIIITITIIVVIIIANIITQNNTTKIVDEINQMLYSVRDKIMEQEVNKEEIQLSMENIQNVWDEKQKKMAYYIEHDELEKVETEMKRLKADIDVQNYSLAVENLDNCIFILEHIKDKSALKIVNLF